MDQKDIDNLVTVVPSSTGPYFAYASPILALKLLETLDPKTPIHYHSPNRQYDYFKEAKAHSNRFFGYPYYVENYVVETPVVDFLRTFRSAINQVQQKIDTEIAKLKKHYSLPEDHFIPLPALWGPTSQGTMAEMLPDPANALVLTLPLKNSQEHKTEVHILTSDTTIPVFNDYIATALGGLGTIHFLDTWELSSIYGNVNCSTNVFRWPPS